MNLGIDLANRLIYNVHISTLKINTTGKRLATLMKTNEKVFHVNDLANLWLIKNKNTLRTTLKRYSQTGITHRVYKGFYSLVPISEIDPATLGAKALHGFCYLSSETILYLEGYIGQKIDYYTFISAKSQKYTIGKNHYISRQLSDKFLYNSAGIYIKNGLQMANVDRAIADILYFNPKYHFDRQVDWKKIKKIQQTIGYPLTLQRYDFT